MRDWIQRSWFRHPLSLRPFFRITWRPKGVGLGLVFDTVWDSGYHANHPLIVQFTLIKWVLEVGIIDSN